MLDPSRITLKAAGRFVSENVTVASNLAEHITSGERSSVDELKRGEAALIRQGTKKVAAYRDQNGKLHHALGGMHAFGMRPSLEFI